MVVRSMVVYSTYFVRGKDNCPLAGFSSSMLGVAGSSRRGLPTTTTGLISNQDSMVYGTQ